MKTLLILRHGKSSWDNPDLADHDRPLKKRGERDAPRIGMLLRNESLAPDIIITSTALRARRTAELVAEHCGYRAELVENAAMYPGAPPDHLNVLKQVDDAHERVMIVAHNPGLEELLQGLTGAQEALPTAALARVTLPVSHWQELGLDTTGRLEQLWRPKALDDSALRA